MLTSIPLPLVVLIFLQSLLVANEAEGLREAKEAHELVLAIAVKEVARSMATETQFALKKKDYARVVELNESLSDFLSTEDNPASLIVVPEIAESYALKRKESARTVLQFYREEVNASRLASDPITEEMEDFIKKETDAQKLTNSDKKNSRDSSEPRESSSSRSQESLPRKSSRGSSESGQSDRVSAKSKGTKPSARSPANSPSRPSGPRVDPAVLTPEAIEELEDRILEIQDDFIEKFDGATTDTQRSKVSAEYRAAVIAECFPQGSPMFIEFECEMINSRGGSLSYIITYSVLEQSVPVVNPPTEIGVSGAYSSLADASAGTRFRMKVPVGVVDESLDEGASYFRERVSNYSLGVDFNEKFTKLADLPVMLVKDKPASTSGIRHPITQFSVSLFAIWPLVKIESDEIRALPTYKNPNMQILGGRSLR